MSANDETPAGGGEELEALKAKLADTESKLASASGELAEGRQKRQELEGERDALQLKVKELSEKAPPGDPAEAGKAAALAVLQEREASEVKANAASAEAAFKARYKEFAADSDQGGIKFAAVLERYKQFNQTGKKSVEDFARMLEDAYTLVNPQRSVPTGTTFAPYASTTSQPGTSSQTADVSKLTSAEKDIVARLGWSEEQYLKQKEKRPTYIASLLRSSQG